MSPAAAPRPLDRHITRSLTDAALLTGFPTGTQEALDAACTLHLADIGHGPDS